ncbi:pyocin knob domain-containing protein [Paenibacillus tepidiphilus]|uniref:pyocin knob domain-containing protein n=1 Tax=Paenibacillus tepidiphilus TaxID=2608683 RepID=UPI00193E10AA|nr:pyocin knob domain-containing protein [Paenibacillus tepidiphilus]
MKTTNNLKLKKPDGSDYVDIADLNSNMDLIDTAVKGVQDHTADAVKHVTAAERSAWNGKASTTAATSSAAGLMSAADKTKLDGVATGANNYTHPAGDGNQHVPATGTTNNTKVLKAGATAGSAAWGAINASEVVEDASHRFATDAEKAVWSGKAPLVSPAFTGTPTAPTVVAGTVSTQLANTAFVNTNATKRIVLTGQGQNTSYRRTVVALCDVTNTDAAASSYSNGLLTMHRYNGLSGQVTALVACEKHYNSNAMNYTALRMGVGAGRFRPCTFTYKGVKYGGLDIYIADAELRDIEFNGATNFGIFAVDYYNNQTSTVINVEINNSLSSVEGTDYFPIGDFTFNGAGINAVSLGGVAADDYALLASPAFTGTPTAPTAAKGTDTEQIATTAYVMDSALRLGFLGAGDFNTFLTPGMYRLGAGGDFTNGPGTYAYGQLLVVRGGNYDTYAQIVIPYNNANIAYRTGTVSSIASATWLTLWNQGNFNPTTKADLASPAFTGIPTAPTPASTVNNTQLATTAFVQTLIGAQMTAPVQLANGTDLDTIITSGFYRLGTGHVNVPAGLNTDYGMLIVSRLSTVVTQMFVPSRGSISWAVRGGTPSNAGGTGTLPAWTLFAGLDTNGDVALSAIPDQVQKYSLTQDSGRNRRLDDNTDLNTVTLAGFYDGTQLVNVPPVGEHSSLWWHIMVQTHSGASNGENYVIQRASGLSTVGLWEFTRRRYNGVWSEWREVQTYKDQNLKAPTDLPSTYTGKTTTIFFVNNVAGWPRSYGTVVTMKGHTAAESGVTQYFYPYNNDDSIKYRHGLFNQNAWGEWRELLDSTHAAKTLMQRDTAPSNLNNATTPGSYLLGAEASHSNGPGFAWAILDVTVNNSGYVKQVATQVLGNNQKYRSRSETGTWSSWIKLVTEPDLTAAVQAPPYAVTAGTNAALTASISPALTALSAGLRVTIKVHVAVAGSVTLNLNSLGTKSIKKPNGNNPTLALGGVYTLVYDGTAFILQGEGGEYGTAAASDVLAGKTIGTESGLITGTMANNGAGGTVTPTSSAQTKPAGFYSSAITIAGVSVPAASVVAGTTIAGVAGALPSRANDQLSGTINYEGNGRMAVGFPTGAYVTNSGFGNGLASVAIQDPDFISSNIRNGVNIFGVIGSLIEGKRYASGYHTVQGVFEDVFIGNLGFAPRTAIARKADGTDDYGIYQPDLGINIYVRYGYVWNNAWKPDYLASNSLSLYLPDYVTLSGTYNYYVFG